MPYVAVASARRHFFKFGGDAVRILSFDQSTVLTGYAVFDNETLVSHGVIDFHKEDDLLARANMMWIEIDGLIQDLRPDVIVYEGVALQNNAQVLIKLGNLQGHIMASAWRANIPFVSYLPTTWRKRLGFRQGGGVKRSELKKQAVTIVEETYGIHVREDEAEAVAIGLAYIKEQKEINGNVRKEDCEEEQILPF